MDTLHIRVTAVAVFAALATSALAAEAPEAQAFFVSETTPIVSGVNANTSDRPVAVGADGTSTVIWHETSSDFKTAVVHARRVAAGGTPGPVLTLSVPETNSIQPVVAAGPAGRSFAAWRESGAPSGFSSVKGRWIEADGTLSPILTILTADAQTDAVALRAVVDHAGVATVVWRNQRSGASLALRRIAADGSLAPQVVGVGSGADHVAAALPDGSTVVAWRGNGIESNVVSAGGTAGFPAKASVNCGLCAEPGLAVDDEGNGLVAWRFQGSNKFAVVARRLTTAGAPTGDEIVVDGLASDFVGIPVRVAADSHDDFLITWDRDNSGWERRFSSTGTFASAAQQVSSNGEADSLVPVLEDRGSGATVWRASLEHNTSSVRGRAILSNGLPIGDQPDLAPGFSSVEGSGAPAAGLAAFVSTKFVASGVHDLSLSRYMVPPICSDSSDHVDQGKPISTPLRCAGPGIERIEITAAPKHGKLGRFSPAGATLPYAPTPGYAGPDSYSYRAVNDTGQSSVATVSIAVGRDTVRPKVTSVALKKGKLTVGKPRPLSFALAYSEPARAKVTVRKRQKNGTFRVIGSVTTTRFKLTANPPIKGDLLRRIRKGGRFRTFAVATDRAGNGSARRLLKLKLPVRR